MYPPDYTCPYTQFHWDVRDPPNEMPREDFPPDYTDVIRRVYLKSVELNKTQLQDILKTHLEHSSSALQITKWLENQVGWETLSESACYFGESFEITSDRTLCGKCYLKAEKCFSSVINKKVHCIVLRKDLRDQRCFWCLKLVHNARAITSCPDCLLTFGINATASPIYQDVATTSSTSS